MQNELESTKLEIRELKTQITELEKEKYTTLLSVLYVLCCRRHVTSNTKTTEVRYKRIVEELDRCKTTIETLKQNEKETRQFARKDYDKLVSENAKLERQKSELVVALRKQFKMIDILKKQKTHLETAKCLSFTEDEFVKIISTYSRLRLHILSCFQDHF